MAKLPVEKRDCRRLRFCAPLVLVVLVGLVASAQQNMPNDLAEGPMLGPGAASAPGPGAASPAMSEPNALLPGGPNAFAKPAEEMVVDVQIEGNRGVSKDKILPHVRTRAGRPYDPEIIEKDVRELNRTRMFVTVRPLTKRVQGGRLVIFQVVERPILKQVLVIGNQGVWTKTLKKEIDLKPGDAADPFAVEEGRRRIEEYYQKKGFSKIRVTILEGNKPGDLSAIYVINEGPKQKVLWIKFVGNTIVSGQRLKTQIKSGLPILYIFKGEVDRKQIDEDVERLTAYYRGLGFFRARIGRELEFNEKQNWLTLTFVIDEGPRYTVRNVSFIGNTKFTSEQLAEKLKLQGNQFYNQSQMLADVNSIQEQYGSIGYVFADIKAENRFLDEPGQLDIVYNVGEGDRYRVGRVNVEIKGENPHTRITTVLNRLSLKTGDIVDIRELRASERRLKASGLFMVDPTKGVQPKIVFSPPESEDKENESGLAGRPRPHTTRYGPSEDSALPPLPPGERYLDMHLPTGAWGETEPRRPNVAGPVWLPPTLPQAQPGNLPSYPAAPPPSGPVQPMEQPTVIRGQYTGDFGTPSPSPTRPLYGSVPAASGANPQYAQPSGQLNNGARMTPAPVNPQYANQGPAAPWAEPGNFATGEASPSPSNGVFNDPAPPPWTAPGGDPTRELPLFIRTEEAQTGRLMFGVGVNSDAGVVGSIVLDEQNFDWTRFPRGWEDIRNATAWRGAGQRFRIEAVPGTEVQRYMINFQEPYLADTDVSLGLSAFYFDRIYTEWRENRVGGRVSLGIQITPDWSGSIAFRGMNVNISRPQYPVPDLMEVIGNNALYGIGATIANDTRDSAFLATEGHLISMSVEQVVGDFKYPHAEIEASQYFKLHERPDGSGRHVLSLTAKAGFSGDNTPIFERYFAGGFSTIRGFRFRGVSPLDPTYGMAVGGNFELLASAQYLFPITADDMLRGVLFCDTGTVQQDIDKWNEKYRVAPGFGLRIVIPALGPAPIALDFAFPVSKEPGDRREVFSFFVGFNK